MEEKCLWCGAAVHRDDSLWPFCSHHCRLHHKQMKEDESNAN